jgi:antitoxin component YwqK of YwqJK toxin-antitoxin module
MTRDEHLEFCSRCTNRKFDSDQGIICGLTNNIAAFQTTCDNYNVDTSITTVRPPVESIPDHKLVEGLPENVKSLLRKQQDPVLAAVGGLSAAILGAIIWAIITVATNYQIGYMAIAVGLLVGFAVRYFGAGVDKYFGYIGAVLALVGCALGNLLSQIIFAADAESVGYMDILVMLNFDLIVLIFEETFSPMDVLFYGIAAYEGYKFAFRKITEEIYEKAGSGQLSPLPFGQFRIPIAVVLYLMFAVLGFTMRSASEGEKITYYPTGEKQSSGFVVGGKESGMWQYWWENGKPRSKGLFIDGKADSTWEYYSEEGELYRRASFKNGIENGSYTELQSDGTVSSTGSYLNGRKDGEWRFFYEDGVLAEKGNYKLDMAEGVWESFHPNGKPSLISTYKANEPRGLWTMWNEEGLKVYEMDYGTEGKMTILNTWNSSGKPEVKNGNGSYNAYYPDGKLVETGMVKERMKVGTWKRFYENGNKQEVGHYDNGVYYVDDRWSPEGDVLIEKGAGVFESYDPQGGLAETGKVSGGLREGEWIAYYPLTDKTVMSSTQYVNGEPEGIQQFFFEDGTVQIEGSMKNGKREGIWKWYYQNSTVESSVNFEAGKKEGEQTFFLDDGTLSRMEVYKQGELVENKAAL